MMDGPVQPLSQTDFAGGFLEEGRVPPHISWRAQVGFRKLPANTALWLRRISQALRSSEHRQHPAGLPWAPAAGHHVLLCGTEVAYWDELSLEQPTQCVSRWLPVTGWWLLISRASRVSLC